MNYRLEKFRISYTRTANLAKTTALSLFDETEKVNYMPEQSRFLNQCDGMEGSSETKEARSDYLNYLKAAKYKQAVAESWSPFF